MKFGVAGTGFIKKGDFDVFYSIRLAWTVRCTQPSRTLNLQIDSSPSLAVGTLKIRLLLLSVSKDVVPKRLQLEAAKLVVTQHAVLFDEIARI